MIINVNMEITQEELSKLVSDALKAEGNGLPPSAVLNVTVSPARPAVPVATPAQEPTVPKA